MVTVHSGDIHPLAYRGLKNSIVRFFLKHISIVIGVSDELVKLTMDKTGTPESRMRRIDMGVDLSLFKPALPGGKDEAKIDNVQSSSQFT